MIIGQFNDSFPPIMDGVANVVKNYAYWLNKKYGQSCVITPIVPGYKDNEAFEVYRYNSLPSLIKKPYRVGLPDLSGRVKKKLENMNFDIIHTHSPFSAGVFAKRIAAKKNIPVITTFHSKLYDDFKQILKSDTVSKMALEKAIDYYNSTDYVWTVNKGTAQTLKDYGYRGNIDIVHNGTDFTYPADYNERKKVIDLELNISSSDTVLLFTGQIIWQKNIKLVLQAIKILKSEHVKLKIIFAGEGNAKKEFLSLINQYNIKDYVIYLGLVSDREYLKSLFARADLFVFPSIYDNAPIVIQEAAALKCPSILIKDSNSAEGVVHNENGFLCENDAVHLSKTIKEVVNSKENLNKVGNNAYHSLYRTWEIVVDEVYEKYSYILKNINSKKRR